MNDFTGYVMSFLFLLCYYKVVFKESKISNICCIFLIVFRDFIYQYFV